MKLIIKKSSLLSSALRLLGAGIVSISMKGKRPLVRWTSFRTQPLTEAEVRAWPWERADCLALLCQGHLTGLDYDDPAAFEQVRTQVPAGVFIEKTPRGGFHLLFKMQRPPKPGKNSLCEVKAEGLLLNVYGRNINGLLKLPFVNDISFLTGTTNADDLPLKKLITALPRAGFTSAGKTKRELRFDFNGADRAGVIYDYSRFICYSPNTIFTKDKIYSINDALRVLGVLVLPDIQDAASAVRAKPPQGPEIISGLLRAGHKLVFSAPSKSGKTFALINLALSLASGGNWLNLRCRKSKVLFVNLEVNAVTFLWRLEAVALALKTKLDDLFIWSLRGKKLDPDNFVDELVARIRGQDFEAVIIDPVYKIELSAPGADENNAGHRAGVLRALDRLAEEASTAIIYSAHFPKGSQAHRDAIDRAAGSGVVGRDADALVVMSPLSVENSYRIEFIARDFPAPSPITVRWQYPTHIIDLALSSIGLRGERKRAGTLTPAMFQAAYESARDAGGRASISEIKRLLGKGSCATFWRLANELRGQGVARLCVGKQNIYPESVS